MVTTTEASASFLLHIPGCRTSCAVGLIVSLTVFLAVLVVLVVLMTVLLCRRRRRLAQRRQLQEELRMCREAQAHAMTPEVYLRENLAYSHVGECVPPPYSQPEEGPDPEYPKPPSDHDDDDPLLEADPPPTYEEATEFVCPVSPDAGLASSATADAREQDLIDLGDLPHAQRECPPHALRPPRMHAHSLTIEAIIEANPEDLGDEINGLVLEPCREHRIV